MRTRDRNAWHGARNRSPYACTGAVATTIARDPHLAFNTLCLVARPIAVLIGIVLMNIPEAARFSAPCGGLFGLVPDRGMGMRRPVPARA